MSKDYKEQAKRTKANKIKRLEKMLEQNPDNKQARERLDHWRKQA